MAGRAVINLELISHVVVWKEVHPARKINLVLSFDYSLAQVLALVMSVWDIRILDFPGILVFPIDLFFLAVILKLFSRSNRLREKNFYGRFLLKFWGSWGLGSWTLYAGMALFLLKQSRWKWTINRYIHLDGGYRLFRDIWSLWTFIRIWIFESQI